MHRYLFLSLALAACVPDSGDEGILILKNVAPGEGCVLTADETEPGVTHGELSSAIPTQYSFIAQMKSRITALETQIDQRTVFISGANIDLTFPDSTFFTEEEQAAMRMQGITRFRSLFAATITPNGGITDAGFDATTLALYDAIYAKAPSARVIGGDPYFTLEVVSTITVTGTMSGDEVTSQPYAFPIRISNDALVKVAGTCPVPSETPISVGNECGRPQDGVITCCNSGSDLLCPPTVE